MFIEIVIVMQTLIEHLHRYARQCTLQFSEVGHVTFIHFADEGAETKRVYIICSI